MKNYLQKWQFYFNITKLFLVVIFFKTTATAHTSIKIPDKTDDFESLILKNYLYIDKTMLIEEYLKLSLKNTSTTLTIHRPEGWGKTTNIKMLEKFLRIEVDDGGEPQPAEATINTKLFLGGPIEPDGRTLEPLKIANSKNIVRYLGQHPVILLELGNATGKDYEEIERGIKSSVMDAYRVHEYLMCSPRVTDKDKLKNYLIGEFYVDDLITSIYFLSKKLYEHFGRKVHILIDDYDIPLMSASVNNHTVDYQEVKSLLQNIYENALKENPYRTTALLVGVYPVELSANSTLDYISILSVHPIIEFFGFASSEVKTIVEGSSIETNLEELQNWYGGYNSNGVKDYYNIRSVIRFLAHNGTFAYYGPSIKTDICKVESSEYQYLDDETTEIYCNQSDDIFGALAQRELFEGVDGLCYMITSSLTNNSHHSSPSYSDDSWSDKHFKSRLTLFYYGYLSAHRNAVLDEQDYELFASSQITQQEFIILQTLQLKYSEFSIPNNEARYFYELKAFQWICYMFEIDSYEFTSFVQILLQDQVNQFLTTIPRYLTKSKVYNYFQSVDRTKIELHHDFMLSIKHVLSLTHMIKYVDGNTKDIKQIHRGTPIYQTNMIFVPKFNQSDVEMVIAYEVAEEMEDLMSTAELNLEKINSYYSNASSIWQMNPRAKKQIKMSLVFYDDNVAVKYARSEL